MTLIAAFRCRNNGILLCADRKEDDTVSVRPIDKIHRISGLKECEVFIAGSGTTTSVMDVRREIEEALRIADQTGNILANHRSIIENSLRTVHQRNREDLKLWPLGLLIVIAPRIAGAIPIMYRTDKSLLVSESTYAAYGSGKRISDYLADRLYVHGEENGLLITLAAFICRESEDSSSGVGLGNDMVLINTSGHSLQFLHTDSIREIQDGIPALRDVVFSLWHTHVKSPAWLTKDYADFSESKK